jgi:Uma2 family endonuclease
LRNQEPITLSDSEPEPDLAVVRGSEDDYAHSHPGPADTALVIEVADSTLREDRWKRAIYSKAGISIYLIINLPKQSIEFYSTPNAAGYGGRQVYGADDEVTVAIEQGSIRFRLRDVLPPSAST